ncbi:hypothetical protein IQ07DRAFT_593172 [Pyrenochaeta sp. DS3sAY3a]|nr:hypothetical protein IQ07DRAFT_593172 [Pyrenochaeta sp. DS3sAY3a]
MCNLTCPQQLWPSESEIIDGRNVANCFFEQNYYCLDYATPKCCWLNGILGPNDLHWQDNGMAYFRAMSRAMAMSCRGTIYILTDNPYDVMKPLPEYATTPSIWIYDEVDEMRALYAQGSITDVKAIIYTPFMINPSVMDVTDIVFGNGRKVKRSVDDDLQMKIALSMQKKFAAQTAEMIMSGEIEMPTLDGIQKRTPWCTNSYLQENPYLDYFG